MKGSIKRKCLCCRKFYDPDPRNLRHQRYCSKPACRKQSKAQSQRQWQQKPENQNYFRSPENSQRVKEWRKRNPGYRRKKKVRIEGVLQEVIQAQAAHNEEVIPQKRGDALQDLFSMQPTVVVGLISMMTGRVLQEDIVSTVGVLVRKGRDILGINPGWEPARFSDENQTTALSRAAAPSTASV